MQAPRVKQPKTTYAPKAATAPSVRHCDLLSLQLEIPPLYTILFSTSHSRCKAGKKAAAKAGAGVEDDDDDDDSREEIVAARNARPGAGGPTRTRPIATRTFVAGSHRIVPAAAKATVGSKLSAIAKVCSLYRVFYLKLSSPRHPLLTNPNRTLGDEHQEETCGWANTSGHCRR